MKKLATSLVLSLALVASPAVAMQKYGVTMPDTTTVNGKELELQGMGLRERWTVDVYVAGLYLEDPSAGPLSAQTKQAKLVMLRDLGKDKVGEAIREGFEANPENDMAALKPRLDQLINALADVKKGEQLVLTYAPGKGTLVTSGGKQLVTIDGDDFAKALFAVWVGPKPIDAKLKREMLGGK